VVSNAEALAKLSPEDPEIMPELGSQTYQDPKGWSDASAQLDPTTRAGAVKKITDPARAAGLVSTGYLESFGQAIAIANNKGLFAYGRNTEAVLTATVRTPDGMGSGWGGGAHWDFNKIDAAAIGAMAIEKAKASREAVALEPGRYTVVLEPTAVGNLVQLIGFALSARQADEGRSFFTKQGGGNKIGTKVVDERVSVWSDPMDPDLYGTTFTGEGLPIGRTVWIENGVLQNLAYDRYWAQKQGKQPNGGGGFKMSGGESSIEDLIRGTQRGILVTRFWYNRPHA
jgi:predicted Zn-dependent protease